MKDLPEQQPAGGRRIAVLCGGSGSEREVSLVSGRSVAQALGGLGLAHDLFELARDRLPDGLSPGVHAVLPLVHGTYGEDGQLSADLERLGCAYAGSGPAASALCFDKYACKAVACRLGLPVAPDLLLGRGEAVTWEGLAAVLGSRVILKPRRDGSSVGLHLVADADGFAAAAEDLARLDYLAESYVAGYDLTVGVLDGRALGVVGVHPQGGLYDYRHKYTSGLSRYEVPAAIDDALAARLRAASERIFAACGCRDLARVDFRLGPDGQAVFLEVNTLPGMTPTSLLPKSAQCAGITFAQLVDRWAGMALQRAGGGGAP